MIDVPELQALVAQRKKQKMTWVSIPVETLEELVEQYQKPVPPGFLFPGGQYPGG